MSTFVVRALDRLYLESDYMASRQPHSLMCVVARKGEHVTCIFKFIFGFTLVFCFGKQGKEFKDGRKYND